ncbi:MAG: TetR/AcrR family transcriptional regulator [bacterium]
MNKKERILQATLKELAENGFEKTRVKDIADKAGVGKGTLYLYFEDKADLYLSSMEYMMTEWLKYADDAVNADGDALFKLNNYFDITVNGLISNRSFAKLLMRELPGFLIKVKKDNKKGPMKMYNKRSRQLSQIIEEGKREGIFRDIDSDIAVNIIIGSLNTFMMQYIIMSEKFSETKYERYKKFIIDMLKKEEE